MPTGTATRGRMERLDFNPLPFMEDYLEELAASQGSASHVRTTRNGLAHFSNFCKTERITHPGEVTRLHLIRFQAWCNQQVTDQSWAKSTSIQNQKKVRAWLNWLVDVGVLEESPWRAIRLGVVKKQPKPLSDDEIDRLFAAHRQNSLNTDGFMFHRREVILSLLYAWGLRIHELCAIDMADMDNRLDFVTVINKGGTTKTMPFTPELKSVIKRWMSVRPRHAERDEPALLITTSGARLTPGGVYETIVALGVKADVQLNPHRLRDSAGTFYLDNDVDPTRVQKLYAHTNLAQTLAYARVNDRKLYEDVEATMDPHLFNLLRRTGS